MLNLLAVRAKFETGFEERSTPRNLIGSCSTSANGGSDTVGFCEGCLGLSNLQPPDQARELSFSISYPRERCQRVTLGDHSFQDFA